MNTQTKPQDNSLFTKIHHRLKPGQFLGFGIAFCLALLAALAAYGQNSRLPTRQSQGVEVAAIYFPGYHHDAHYDSWLLQRATH